MLAFVFNLHSLTDKSRIYFYKMLPESAENLHWTLVETLMRYVLMKPYLAIQIAADTGSSSTLGFITTADTGSLLNR